MNIVNKERKKYLFQCKFKNNNYFMYPEINLFTINNNPNIKIFPAVFYNFMHVIFDNEYCGSNKDTGFFS